MTFCQTCIGVSLEYDKADGKWKAPYVEGAVYCDCLHFVPKSEIIAEWEQGQESISPKM